MIRFRCPNCTQKIKVPEIHAGKKGKCPKCKTTVVVPIRQVKQKPIPPQNHQNLNNQQQEKQQTQKPFYADTSFWSLVLSNIVVIYLAIKQNWPLSQLMWIYWAQSVIIGFFWFLKIFTLKDFSTKGVRVNGEPLEATENAKYKTGFFFLVHFGLSHCAYYFFLEQSQNRLITSIGFTTLWLTIAIFFINQLFSFIYNFKKREQEKPNIGKLMFFPYARIIPMHLTIVTGGIIAKNNPGKYLLLFLALKMLADVIMYAVELRGFQDKPEQKTAAAQKTSTIQKNPSKIPAPPRNISFFLQLVAFLGSDAMIGGLIVFGISIVSCIVIDENNLNPWWKLLCLIGPALLVNGLYKGFLFSWLLKHGQVGLAKVVDIVEKEHQNSRNRNKSVTYKIYYEFLANDGKTYETKIHTGHPALLIDEKYEILFYRQKNPSNAVLLDYLPGGLEPDKNGNIVIGSPFKAIMHLLPATAFIAGTIVLIIFLT